MRPRLMFGTLVLTICFVFPLHALIISFGTREIADAGKGCVAGLTSDHGSTAYFHGDTALLNRQLKKLAGRKTRRISVVLHAGHFKIDDPEERPVLNSASVPRQLKVNWSIRKACSFADVVAGTCDCANQTTTIDVWIGEKIKLSELHVPASFSVTSAGEIEAFVRLHDLKKTPRRVETD